MSKKRQGLNEVLETLDKEKFIEAFHEPQLLSELCITFNLNRSRCNQLIHLFNLEHSEAEQKILNQKIHKTSKEGIYKKYGTEYIFELDSFKEKAANTKLKKYNDSKYNNREKAKATNLERYGVKSVMQNDEIKQKLKNSNLAKYGVENVFQNEEIKKKIKETNLERYGVESPLQLTEIKEKAINTSIKHYGTKHPMQSNEVKDKIKQTNNERYGCDWGLQNADIRNKIKTTCYKNLGTDSPIKNENIRRKIANTNLEKYGVENVFQNEEIKKKIKETNLQKYGVKNPAQSKVIQNKIINTNMAKYGVPYSAQSLKVKLKAKQTNMERYGVKYPTQSKEILDKIKQTNLEKYGVPYFCMMPDARNASNNSSYNTNFANLLEYYGLKYSTEHVNSIEYYSREFNLDSFSFDFKINKTLIEINPFATHNSTWGIYNNPKSNLYHKNKSETAIKNGFNCIHIWDWDNPDKICKQLLLPKEKIFGRNCSLQIVNDNDASQFINENHIQNYIKAKINLGLYYNNELVSIMTFGKPRYNKNYEYELLRYCSSKLVIGGAEKLFKYFIKNYNPSSIISYCDLSKFSGNVYKKLGFNLKTTNIKPSKHWYNPKTKQHITDNLLRQRGFDQLFNTNYGKGISNEQLMLDAGFVEIYDSGQATYIWTNVK